jgi:hypothetical protein
VGAEAQSPESKNRTEKIFEMTTKAIKSLHTDCELLDPRLLRETKRRIVYTEHFTLSYAAPVSQGHFTIQVSGAPAGVYHLELASVHVNGEVSRHRPRIDVVSGNQSGD